MHKICLLNPYLLLQFMRITTSNFIIHQRLNYHNNSIKIIDAKDTSQREIINFKIIDSIERGMETNIGEGQHKGVKYLLVQKSRHRYSYLNC